MRKGYSAECQTGARRRPGISRRRRLDRRRIRAPGRLDRPDRPPRATSRAGIESNPTHSHRSRLAGLVAFDRRDMPSMTEHPNKTKPRVALRGF
jgi:hypothetical protein